MKPYSLMALLLVLGIASAARIQAAIPDGLKFKTFYDTTKVRFDGIMWFEEIPGKKGHFLVAEQNGKVWTFNHAAATKTLFMDFPTYSNNNYHEDGLLGMAFHPKFTENRKIYAYYTPGSSRANLAIGEFMADASYLKDSGVPVKNLWTAPVSGGHNGATVQFGPDGFLYWAVGQDHGRHGTAQDMKSPRGKMYRIDVDIPGVDGKAYSIPADNPYVKDDRVPAKEIWAHGFRNPMKFSFDKLTGDLWEVEVGQWYFEDVNIVRKGDNMGWDIMEGTSCYSWADEFTPLSTCNKTSLVPPVWSIPHLDPKNKWLNSGTGGLVYRANPASKFYGVYLFGDFCSKQIFGLTQKDRKMVEVKEYDRAPLGPIHFAADSEGNVYMAGWYHSAEYITAKRASQILVMDHSELQLGVPTAIRKTAEGRAPGNNRGGFVRLPGIPAGYFGGTDALGRAYRTYAPSSRSSDHGSTRDNP